MLCQYGSRSNFIDVTKIVQERFKVGNFILFPLGFKNFNSYFGDPSPYVSKYLLIHRPSEPTYVIPEHDVNPHIFPIRSFGTCEAITDPGYYYLKMNLVSIHRTEIMVRLKDPRYFNVSILNPQPHVDVSIVMRSFNCPDSTYFTLASIGKQKKLVQVIIVDDSDTDPLDPEILKQYSMEIYYVRTQNKFWINAGVTYNLGFSFVRGSKTIIHPAEICHIGNVIQYVENNLDEKSYLAFHVGTFIDSKVKSTFQELNPTPENYLHWSPLLTPQNRKCSFLTAISTPVYFDYDYGFGIGYEDLDLIERIENMGYNIKTVESLDQMGVHQGDKSTHEWVMTNEYLYHAKLKYYSQHNKYFQVTQSSPEILYK